MYLGNLRSICSDLFEKTLPELLFHFGLDLEEEEPDWGKIQEEVSNNS